jgi:hypothetical protein
VIEEKRKRIEPQRSTIKKKEKKAKKWEEGIRAIRE